MISRSISLPFTGIAGPIPRVSCRYKEAIGSSMFFAPGGSLKELGAIYAAH
jgi:hypothetical protein